LQARAIPGIEHVEGGVYARTAKLGGRPAAIEVRRARADALEVKLCGVPARELFPAVERVSRLFDVDADTLAIASALGATPELAPLIRARPGLRVPGAWDAFEIAVRAVLGQQISVARASALAGRLVEAFGEPLAESRGKLTHLFPAPNALAEAEIERVGLPRARAEAVRSVARAASRGDLDANAAGGLEAALTRLEALPGVGPWTANYVAMRALNEPDAFPASDLGLRKALGAGGTLASERDVLRASEAWRPFRAYAAMHLWASLAG
jgi:3-methyladenine DNA glycosylase/8-oxoguanine DNA glycosylase